ncbi:MAG: CoA-binding protein [Peptococcaceae bacterium]|nr:CoA-binding protein [Peptococcaceae bacterium]
MESIIAGGYQGAVFPVNGKYREINGRQCYPDLASLPRVPDLAILAVNQHATVQLAKTCADLGVKGLICPAGGFKEMGEEGRELEEQLRNTALTAGILVVGPNTLGLINTKASFYATFYPMKLDRGVVSVISQSGGMGLSILGLLQDEGVGVAKWVGVGNRGTLEFTDYLRYLAEDPDTGVIGVFMEGTGQGRTFVQTAAVVARHKPVVVFKGGRGKAAEGSALTHTGTMAGPYRLYRDIFAQHRVMTVDSVEELVYSLKALAIAPSGPARKVGVITHTAGPGIVAADALEDAGCVLPPLKTETIDRVLKVIGPNPPVVLRNPLDLAASGFAAGSYGECAKALAYDPGIEAIMAIYCHHGNWAFPSMELIRLRRISHKPLVACYIGQNESLKADRPYLHEAGIPLYSSIWGAARGLAAIRFYGGGGING